MSTPVNTAVYGCQLTGSMGLSDPINGYSLYHSQGDAGTGAVAINRCHMTHTYGDGAKSYQLQPCLTTKIQK